MVAKPFDQTILQPGDTILYRPTAFSLEKFGGWLFGRLIALKSWHNISHVEVYVGGGESVASRDGEGVNRYLWRSTEIGYVLRPGQPVDLVIGMRWFNGVRGQGYDWLGLTRFVRTSIVSSQTKMFCSAFWLRFYRACAFNPFSAIVDADSIAPGEIIDCPNLEVIWTDGLDPDVTIGPPVGV